MDDLLTDFVIQQIDLSREKVILLGSQHSKTKLLASQTPPKVIKFGNEAIHEYEIVQTLIHPNILKYYGVVFDPQYGTGLQMEFCQRGTLEKIIFDSRIIYTINTEIVHRDIKPANIFVTEDFSLKIGNFQYSMGVQWEVNEDLAVTYSTDIYSMGIVFWEIIERRYAFRSENKIYNDYSHFADFQKEQTAGLHFSYSGCKEFKETILECAAFDPRERPNAEEVLEKIIIIKNDKEIQQYEFMPIIDNDRTRIMRPDNVLPNSFTPREESEVETFPSLNSEANHDLITSSQVDDMQPSTLMFSDEEERSLIQKPTSLFQPLYTINQSGEGTFNKQLFNRIMDQVGNCKIAIISIAGLPRGGKTFWLNFLLRALRKGDAHFKPDEIIGGPSGASFQSGLYSHTTGIQICTETFFINNSESEKIAQVIKQMERKEKSNITSLFEATNELAFNELRMDALKEFERLWNQQNEINAYSPIDPELFEETGKTILETVTQTFAITLKYGGEEKRQRFGQFIQQLRELNVERAQMNFLRFRDLRISEAYDRAMQLYQRGVQRKIVSGVDPATPEELQNVHNNAVHGAIEFFENEASSFPNCSTIFEEKKRKLVASFKNSLTNTLREVSIQAIKDVFYDLCETMLRNYREELAQLRLRLIDSDAFQIETLLNQENEKFADYKMRETFLTVQNLSQRFSIIPVVDLKKFAENVLQTVLDPMIKACSEDFLKSIHFDQEIISIQTSGFQQADIRAKLTQLLGGYRKFVESLSIGIHLRNMQARVAVFVGDEAICIPAGNGQNVFSVPSEQSVFLDSFLGSSESSTNRQLTRAGVLFEMEEMSPRTKALTRLFHGLNQSCEEFLGRPIHECAFAIPKPVAAALASGIKNSSNKSKYIMVYHLRGDARRRLLLACEQAKIDLTQHETALINIPSLKLFDFKITIKRKKFEWICRDVFKEMIAPIDVALKMANLKAKQIDDLLVLGHSTQIQRIQELLKSKVKCEHKSAVNSDEMVVEGAAIQAAKLGGYISKRLTQLSFRDATALSLGVRFRGNLMKVVIPKDSPIPISKQITCTTTYDGQSSMEIQIYEGERAMASANRLLGTLQYKIRRGEKGGELEVFIEDPLTNDSNFLSLRQLRDGFYEADEVKRVIQEANNHAKEDQEFIKKNIILSELDDLAFQMANNLKREFSKLGEPWLTLISNRGYEEMP
ncbi:unnamed protein product, partial [Mesorhabditis belari]|uniref:Protein kinase domain-containing protein n=1 Tax=Mesorhabditis belari TaxID=2138241 RepID=A0AAF3EWL9_9BILA